MWLACLILMCSVNSPLLDLNLDNLRIAHFRNCLVPVYKAHLVRRPLHCIGWNAKVPNNPLEAVFCLRWAKQHCVIDVGKRL